MAHLSENPVPTSMAMAPQPPDGLSRPGRVHGDISRLTTTMRRRPIPCPAFHPIHRIEERSRAAIACIQGVHPLQSEAASARQPHHEGMELMNSRLKQCMLCAFDGVLTR